eukprot:TRINITY_DN1013_c0_g1_i4.p1 TRINITY_DN1013_c0_g1~~TRINITY_DN1013_c0_g1_i4.p1  ORF type:complete len:508 (+),score=81.71 TRINITY_DN1013_c0_g1_i4:193-1716(+)
MNYFFVYYLLVVVAVCQAMMLTVPSLGQGGIGGLGGSGIGQGGFSGLTNLQGGSFVDVIPPVAELTVAEEKDAIEGETPPNVIIEKVVAYPNTGEEDMVVLRNMGGQVADLTGWTMIDSKGDPVYTFGVPGCEGNATILPQASLTVLPENEYNPCGFPFGISLRDWVMLYNDENVLVVNVTWEGSKKGSATRYINGVYIQVSEVDSVVNILSSIPEFSTFSAALVSTGLKEALEGTVNPNYAGIKLPSPPSPDFNIEFPWWFGFAQDRTLFSPPPPPPPPPPSPPLGEVPNLGPYTVLAPIDSAFDQLLLILGGGRVKIPLQGFLRLPELQDILLYHIYYGDYTTDFMFNNTGIKSTLGSEVVVMKDPRWTEGQVALNDACVDKPTQGYPCAQQLEFDKCYEPFMISPLASGWQGGFCQKTCMRCTCDEADSATCAKIVHPDIIAGNGVVHGISRVMFPPPIFDSVEALEEAAPTPESPEDPLTGPGLTGLPGLPGLPQLPTLPGLS